MNDAVVRNAAVIQSQEQILAAQQLHAASVQRVRDLESEVAQFNMWETEKQRYKLKDFGQNTFAYELKPEMANGEPTHFICPQCYETSRKSILQFESLDVYKREGYRCYSCKALLHLGVMRQRDLGMA